MGSLNGVFFFYYNRPYRYIAYGCARAYYMRTNDDGLNLFFVFEDGFGSSLKSVFSVPLHPRACYVMDLSGFRTRNRTRRAGRAIFPYTGFVTCRRRTYTTFRLSRTIPPAYPDDGRDIRRTFLDKRACFAKRSFSVAQSSRGLRLSQSPHLSDRVSSDGVHIL